MKGDENTRAARSGHTAMQRIERRSCLGWSTYSRNAKAKYGISRIAFVDKRRGIEDAPGDSTGRSNDVPRTDSHKVRAPGAPVSGVTCHALWRVPPRREQPGDRHTG